MTVEAKRLREKIISIKERKLKRLFPNMSKNDHGNMKEVTHKTKDIIRSKFINRCLLHFCYAFNATP
jgi:hypothetical protein